MKKLLNIVIIVAFASLLVFIRAFEDSLFYDPLLHFFEGNYKSMPLPKMDTFALQTGIALRFLLNTIVSLVIIWMIFKDKEIIKFSLLLYSVLFVLFFMAFSFIIFTSEDSSGHFVLFYVRRFLIQPLFLLILLPAFYFQKYKSR
ncbi:exosortase F system-associated protein [Aequorivita viscosa]|nr:exosortase F system-associated protein [Aequorivita viscosa]